MNREQEIQELVDTQKIRIHAALWNLRLCSSTELSTAYNSTHVECTTRYGAWGEQVDLKLKCQDEYLGFCSMTKTPQALNDEHDSDDTIIPEAMERAQNYLMDQIVLLAKSLSETEQFEFQMLTGVAL
ncbi:hypothetical protein J4G57_05405 [Aeromonas caviae]|uniref:hypothetical protein n=1 Tax=Aeromonas TaxID=642 RepID=UPI001BD31DE4|nr:MULTISPECIES: hypothetical protein [Aeromonas]MBS4707330.1 hypothetical protein [Aeromonas caviae]MDM5119964.1 hypothetical protein [Aeromonas hydrophila]